MSQIIWDIARWLPTHQSSQINNLLAKPAVEAQLGTSKWPSLLHCYECPRARSNHPASPAGVSHCKPPVFIVMFEQHQLAGWGFQGYFCSMSSTCFTNHLISSYSKLWHLRNCRVNFVRCTKNHAKTTFQLPQLSITTSSLQFHGLGQMLLDAFDWSW